MSSEERQRREEEPPREKSPQEELRAESQETEDVSEPVEVRGSEDPGVVEEIADEDHAEKPADKPPLNEEEPSEEVMPSEEEPAIADEELAALAEELETTRRERDEYLDTLRRLKAEFENSRKRYEREKARILETAAEGLVVELLPVLDNLDRALEAEGDIHEGVQAIRDQLVATLGKEGLLPVASDGQHFDPNVHEAVMSQPSEEHEEGTILQTFQRGYLLNGKPIRPAKVVVSKQV